MTSSHASNRSSKTPLLWLWTGAGTILSETFNLLITNGEVEIPTGSCLVGRVVAVADEVAPTPAEAIAQIRSEQVPRLMACDKPSYSAGAAEQEWRFEAPILKDRARGGQLHRNL
ncbi:hypothetical protein ABIA33_006907 [Streptacidiphilus sp. MAP12-16]|uniref:hypothetical protein n=1 Tax=Streptacidiphilus sp. MAP12-16 TaxID=3156300 RepID=UPI003514AAC5